MKFLDYTPISLTALFPPKAGTLKHLQDISAEGFNATIQALIGSTYDPTIMYILFGCKNTGTGSSYIISAGAVFFNGQYYLVPAATFTISGSNVAVGTITQSNFVDVTADPVKFTDNVLRNVHQIFTVVFAPGLNGSGTANFTDLLMITSNLEQLNLTGSGLANVTGTYPNINVDVSAGAILARGITAVGDVATGSGTDIPVTFATALSTGSYVVMATVESNSGNVTNDTSTVFSIRAKTTTGFIAHFQEVFAFTQNISLAWVVVAL